MIDVSAAKANIGTAMGTCTLGEFYKVANPKGEIPFTEELNIFEWIGTANQSLLCLFGPNMNCVMGTIYKIHSTLNKNSLPINF